MTNRTETTEKLMDMLEVMKSLVISPEQLKVCKCMNISQHGLSLDSKVTYYVLKSSTKEHKDHFKVSNR